MPDSQYLNLELDVYDLDHSSLRFGGADASKRAGHPALTHELVQRLNGEDLDERSYGIALFEALLPEGDDLRVQYRKAVEEAHRTNSKLRFKLGLSLDLREHFHGLCWERLFDPEQEIAIAQHPQSPFSRSPLTGSYAADPVAVHPRLLIAVAAPTDVEQHGMAHIDRKEMERQLAEDLKPLDGVLDYEFLEPPISAQRLSSRLRGSHRQSVHALHLVAHGYIAPNISSGVLVLEQNNGLCDFLTEENLPPIFWRASTLRLLTLMTCHGATLTINDPLSGLGRRLVRSNGLPAVISMQDTVSFATAEEFSRHFYQDLGEHGVVDRAVNEARYQLSLIDPTKSRWSDPLLFTRLKGGALWIPVEKEQKKDPEAIPEPIPEKSDHPKRSFSEIRFPEAKRLGLFIGIGRTHGQVDLLACRNNAQALAKTLASHEDASPNFSVHTFNSPGLPAISKQRLMLALGAVSRSPREDLVIFFSGYGIIEENGFLLVESDGTSDQIVGFEELMAITKVSAIKSISWVFDCYRPSLTKEMELFKGLPPVALPKGTTIFASNRSAEIVGRECSLFTELLINALGGAAADVQGRVWMPAVFAHTEPLLRNWGYKPFFRRLDGGESTLRRCPTKVPIESLRELSSLFPTPEAPYRLSPSHVISHRTAVPTDISSFNHLKFLRNAGLLEVDEGKDLYFAALESRTVRLNHLGQLYWRLAAEKQF